MKKLWETNLVFLLPTFILLVFSLFLSSCGMNVQAQSPIEIDLNNLQPLPTPNDHEVLPFKVAIAAVISPEGTAESYAPLLNYLETKLQRPVKLVQRRTYAEINDLIKTGDVDLAFVCTSAYITGRRDFNMQLLVAPIVNGETYYHSQLIVPVGSPAASLLDLRGKVFAFTDPMSFSGRMFPTYLLQQVGETPASFFQRTFFTYSHDDAIRSVADGLADGAAVDSLVLEFALDRDPALADRINIIYTSPPFGIPPVVVSPLIRPQQHAQLEEIFLNMHTTNAGLEALQSLDVEGFTIVSEELYDAAAEIENAVAGEMDYP
jgi:phosphonate transport system substrate-binding protein